MKSLLIICMLSWLFVTTTQSAPFYECALATRSAENIDDISTQKNKAKELFKQRENKDKLEEAIKIMEDILIKEKDYETMVILSRCYYFLAGFTEDKELKLSIYNKGTNTGLMALNTLEIFAAASKDKKEEESAVKKVTINNLDALYWTAANLARWAKYASFTKRLAAKPRIRYYWDKVQELDSSYFYGGVYRFFGGYYALVPTITGENDHMKSKQNFDKGLTIASEYLETKVLYAETYCTHPKAKDKELFKKLLNEVLTADISKYPEIMPENKMAQEKAKKLLAQETELFE